MTGGFCEVHFFFRHSHGDFVLIQGCGGGGEQVPNVGAGAARAGLGWCVFWVPVKRGLPGGGWVTGTAGAARALYTMIEVVVLGVGVLVEVVILCAATTAPLAASLARDSSIQVGVWPVLLPGGLFAPHKYCSCCLGGVSEKLYEGGLEQTLSQPAPGALNMVESF